MAKTVAKFDNAVESEAHLKGAFGAPEEGYGFPVDAGNLLRTPRQVGLSQATSLLGANKLKGIAEAAAIFAIDFLSLLALFKVALYIRTDMLPIFLSGFPATHPSASVQRLWWLFAIWLFFYSYEGLYTKRFSFWDEIKIICKSSVLAAMGIFAVASIGKLGDEISRTVIILMGTMSLVALPVVRMTSKKTLRRFGLLKRRVLIMGAGETGRLMARALNKEPNYGYQVVGYLDDDPEKVGTEVEGVKVHRGINSACKYLRRGNITDLIIAMPGAGKNRLQRLINDLQHKVDRILFVPDIFGMAVVGTTLQHFFHEQAFALEVKNNLEQPLNYITKRVFDYVVGLVLLVLLSMPLLVISILIRLTSAGPALYRHPRKGKKGRMFMCYKFRTMYADAEERFSEILETDFCAREEWESNWKLKNDPRVTPIGRFLRETSLDELPQIFNVLLGHMSLVGPRPVTQEEIDIYYKDRARLCFSVLPGITGLWQVSGRSNTGYDYRIAIDSWYVRNWDLWLDIVIMLKTLPVVFKKEGAC